MGIKRGDTGQPLKLVQITDCHLGEKAGDDLMGMDTDYSLQQVLELVRAEQGVADLLLATGDLSNHGYLDSYVRFLRATAGLAQHSRWLPGNHDNLALMNQAVADGPELSRCIDIANWRVILLDSTVAREVGGRFSEHELEFLQQSLSQNPSEHALICLHHHPVAIGCEWLDEQMVANADDFFAVVDQFSSVRGILWGHIHQQVEADRQGVKLMSAPSSCIQFAKNSAGFRLDKLNPGYRSLLLYPDGHIDSAISRVTAVDFAINYDAAQGY